MLLFFFFFSSASRLNSGGYNLKVGPSSQIELMKFDMGGCAAVLGAAKAIAELQPENLEVHFISAVCENMISAEAMKPGDILKTSNGKTIEVLNTDAYGGAVGL
jgi:leucyl aminopeptidase